MRGKDKRESSLSRNRHQIVGQVNVFWDGVEGVLGQVSSLFGRSKIPANGNN